MSTRQADRRLRHTYWRRRLTVAVGLAVVVVGAVYLTANLAGRIDAAEWWAALLGADEHAAQHFEPGEQHAGGSGVGERPQPVRSAQADPDKPLDNPVVPPVDPEAATLALLIQDLFDAVRTLAPDVTYSVLVTDAVGRPIAEVSPDIPRIPASTMKVVTGASALTTFGALVGLPTHIETTGPVIDGRLVGDLVLVGGGDPALATEQYRRWVYPIRPISPLEVLADAVRDAGIHTIHGDVIGFAPGHHGPPLADGWPQRYLSDFDARYAAGLTVDAGLRTIITWPEVMVDTNASIPSRASSGSLEPPESSETAPGTANNDRPPQASGIEAFVEVEPVDVKVDHAEDPAHQAAVEYARLLSERGVAIRGLPRSATTADVGPRVDRIATLPGAPVVELVRFALERSDNQMADGLFRAVGNAWVGEFSWLAGAAANERLFKHWGIDATGSAFADGSGLSRDDRLTTRQLVEVDRVMMDSQWALDWIDAMATMGRSGTLRQRLVGTVADGRFHGKTGTLRDVMSMTGTVWDRAVPPARRLHVAVIANDVVGVDRVTTRQFIDQLVLAVTALHAGCEAQFVPGASVTGDHGPQTGLGVVPELGEVVVSCGSDGMALSDP